MGNKNKTTEILTILIANRDKMIRFFNDFKLDKGMIKEMNKTQRMFMYHPHNGMRVYMVEVHSSGGFYCFSQWVYQPWMFGCGL